MIANRFAIALATMVFVTGFFAGNVFQSWSVARAQSQRVYELRTYTPAEGKLQDLHKRFRDHTLRLFEKHGMQNVGYWVPIDPPNSENTLTYIIAHKNREAAKASWAAFGADPEWQKVRKESMADGVSLTTKVESVFLNPTDYSPMK